MARIAQARAAAEPKQPRQRERRRRILHVTTELAQEKGFDGVQMHDVAKGAGVAIATLYRYFPSKTHLFIALMRDQVERLVGATAATPAGQDPLGATYQLLVTAQRQMLARPLLARAMMQSNYSAHAGTVPDAGLIDAAFSDLILRTLGIEVPTANDVRLVRLLVQAWYGTLIQALNGRVSVTDAEGDIHYVCELLLAERSNADQRRVS